MTDSLAIAAIARAQAALQMAIGLDPDSQTTRRAKAFIEGARLTGLVGDKGNPIAAMGASANQTLAKAVAERTGTAIWGGDSMRELAESFIASIAPGDLLSQLARFARPVPIGQRAVMLASGFSADPVNEGSPKVVRNLQLSIDEDNFRKVASIVVATKELLMGTDDKALELIRTELASAILRGSNSAVLGDLPATSTVATTGSAIGDLRAGLKAAGASNAYVVAAAPALVRELALEESAPASFGVAGGDYRQGVSIVPTDIAGMRVIPASRLAVFAGAPELRASSQGTVNMSDTPTSPSTVVALWQTNSIGIIAERMFNVFGDTSSIIEVA